MSFIFKYGAVEYNFYTSVCAYNILQKLCRRALSCPHDQDEFEAFLTAIYGVCHLQTGVSYLGGLSDLSLVFQTFYFVSSYD